MYTILQYLNWHGTPLYEILDEKCNVIADGLSLSLAKRILIVLNGKD